MSLKKLKKLAEAAGELDHYLWVSGNQMGKEYYRYLNAANPDTVLKLIAVVEAAERLDAVGAYWGSEEATNLQIALRALK